MTGHARNLKSFLDAFIQFGGIFWENRFGIIASV